jgi:hypothetical protein
MAPRGSVAAGVDHEARSPRAATRLQLHIMLDAPKSGVLDSTANWPDCPNMYVRLHNLLKVYELQDWGPRQLHALMQMPLGFQSECVLYSN